MAAMGMLKRTWESKFVLLLFGLMGAYFMSSDLFRGSVGYTAAIDDLSAPAGFTGLAERVSPAVVNIRTVKTIKDGGQVFRHFQREPWGQNNPFKEFYEKFFGEEMQKEFKQPSLGSGFIIAKDGYVVTNNHVIEGADQIRVKLNDENEYDAEVVGRDPSTDIALLKIKSDHDLPVVSLGNSDNLKIGQWVVAIGSPFGLEHTVTAGIVSAKGRVIGSGPYDDFIQTDASINPGNSGGPLINMNGEVVGINTAIIASGQGIGFAIPINLAEGVITQLQSEGEVTRGWLGVAIQDITEEMADYYGIENKTGVFVADVFKGDPADQAGIKAKDIILEVNGKKTGSSRQLTSMIAGIAVGQTATLKVLRDSQEKIFRVKVAKRDEAGTASREPARKHGEEFGIQVSDLTPEIAGRFNIAETSGIIVTDVAADGKGAQADVRVGDVIKEINHREVTSRKDYQAILDKIKPGDPVNLFVWRKSSGFLVVKMTK
jgi:serine protease Do